MVSRSKLSCDEANPTQAETANIILTNNTVTEWKDIRDTKKMCNIKTVGNRCANKIGGY